MKQILLIFISLSIILSSRAQDNSNNSIAKSDVNIKEPTSLIFKMGNGMSRMPATIVRSLTEAKVEMNDFSETDYKLQGFTITVLYDDSQTFKKSINPGKNFTEQTKAILSLLKPKDVIVVSGISAINSKGEIVYLPERNFGVY